MTHTSGPWKIVESLSRIEILSDFDTNTFKSDFAIAHIYRRGKCNGRSYTAPANENARLIVVAPEMYDLLKTMEPAARDSIKAATDHPGDAGYVADAEKARALIDVLEKVEGKR